LRDDDKSFYYGAFLLKKWRFTIKRNNGNILTNGKNTRKKEEYYSCKLLKVLIEKVAAFSLLLMVRLKIEQK